ncbi:uncharacterized protein LOC125235601 [Leguminivora glycinivorella]|uniref:uncharacterized protein LOC125235601 n=1 Tax=Leguminivora glycinivorella TaxID=1035111 RepID=UPI00200D8988|nr:uncharacterized protein LOC125235601 [Leguminivora glycinivorella]
MSNFTSNNLHASNQDLTSSQENVSNITQRHKRKQPDCELLAAITAMQTTLQDLRVDLGNKIDSVTTNILTVKNDLESYQAAMKKDFDHLRGEQTQVKKDLEDLTTEVRDLKRSNQFISDQHDQINKSVTEWSRKTTNCAQHENSITSLELKIDGLEQQARQCNIEIQNVPEKKGENLINLVINLGEKIGCTIHRNDIVGVHRVRPATINSKPKHIVVKFGSRVLRDNVLTASRANRGLTSADLGISGTQHKLYINEHLTLRRKQLFRAAREAAKQANYKHKWVSNGTILVRASDTSHTIAIHTEKDIEKIQKREEPATEPSPSTSDLLGRSTTAID